MCLFVSNMIPYPTVLQNFSYILHSYYLHFIVCMLINIIKYFTHSFSKIVFTTHLYVADYFQEK